MSSSSKLHIILLILIPLLLISIWFRNGLIVGGGEEGLSFYDPLKTLKLSKLMWWDYDGGFPTIQWLPKITSVFLISFLYESLKIPNYILQALTYFILIFVGVVSVYFLVFIFLEKAYLRNIIAFVAAIFYILNPFSLSQIWGRGINSQFFSFALLPLALLFFLKGLKGKLIYLVYLTLASVVFTDAFGITTFVITYWTVLTIAFIYWIIINISSPKIILSGFIFYIFSLISWFFSQAWWFLPTLTSASKIYSGKVEGFTENLGTLMGVSKNFTPLVLIRLLQRTYFFDSSAFSTIYSTFIFQLISFLIPLFLIMGVFFIFKIKELSGFRFFIILFILGLAISLGANPPIGWFFVYVFKHITFLQSFRNPYEKFGLVYTLAYSPIFATGLVYFFNSLRFNKFRFLGISLTVILICGIYAWPMWTGKVVSFPNTTPGIDVPKYYQELSNWLNINNKESYRLFMTPLWVGDGSFYQWNKTKYQGIDPIIYILNPPPISSSPNDFPFYYDFMKNIRNYIGRKDISDSLNLFRAKYLVARGDAINISPSEGLHEKYLTDTIYTPLEINNVSKEVCQDRQSSFNGINPAWIQCPLSGADGDLTEVRYLHIIVRVDVPANLDFALTDTKGSRPRWYGKTEDDYFLKANTWTEVFIPLGASTEGSIDTDFSRIELMEVLAHPLHESLSSVGKIELKGVWYDIGQKEQINKFNMVGNFGNLRVYKPINQNFPPEFGLLTSLDETKNFEDLFEKVAQKHDLLNEHGFIVTSQNQSKNLRLLTNSLEAKITDSEKVSATKYWIKLNGQPAYLILSQNYNTEWKVLLGVDKEVLNNGFFEDLKLLKQAFVSEQDHFVVNGYANLWRVDDKDTKYAIVFMPQVIADIGSKLSIFSIILLVGVTILWRIKIYISSH